MFLIIHKMWTDPTLQLKQNTRESNKKKPLNGVHWTNSLFVIHITMPCHETGRGAVVLVLHTGYEWIHLLTFIYFHLLFLKHCDHHSILQSPEESGLGVCCVVLDTALGHRGVGPGLVVSGYRVGNLKFGLGSKEWERVEWSMVQVWCGMVRCGAVRWGVLWADGARPYLFFSRVFADHPFESIEPVRSVSVSQSGGSCCVSLLSARLVAHLTETLQKTPNATQQMPMQQFLHFHIYMCSPLSSVL